MFFEYILVDKKQELTDTCIYTLIPKNKKGFDFTAGQYTLIRNPSYEKPEEDHAFSIASSPARKDHLEFCIKIHGTWTKALSELPLGQSLFVAKPRGKFVWADTISYAVFLLGGTGISPVMSILRTMQQTRQKPKITMFYGNRTPDTIAYKIELEQLQKALPGLSIIHVFSHLPGDLYWEGYRGFMTAEIITNEVDMTLKPTFFTIGPPIFTEKMVAILHNLSISDTDIKVEDFITKK